MAPWLWRRWLWRRLLRRRWLWRAPPRRATRAASGRARLAAAQVPRLHRALSAPPAEEAQRHAARRAGAGHAEKLPQERRRGCGGAPLGGLVGLHGHQRCALLLLRLRLRAGDQRLHVGAEQERPALRRQRHHLQPCGPDAASASRRAPRPGGAASTQRCPPQRIRCASFEPPEWRMRGRQALARPLQRRGLGVRVRV